MPFDPIQTITTNCPECNNEITADFNESVSIRYEDGKRIFRIGFLAELEHYCPSIPV